MMKRKTLQLLTGALLCQPLSAGELQAQEQDKERPNILFILSDDHTSQSWGIYGGILAPYVKNDNIKRLADEGCVLDNCFCTNSISAPSRATILTGAYSHLNGVRTLEVSWADGLKQQLILFQQKSGEIIKERILKDMWNRVMDNFLRKYPEDTLLSEEMLVEMVDEMEKEIIPWYVSRICEVDL